MENDSCPHQDLRLNSGALLPFASMFFGHEKIPESSRFRLITEITSYTYWSGDGGIRTLDPHVANVVLSQLSYTPN